MYKFITINAIRIMAGNLCTCQTLLLDTYAVFLIIVLGIIFLYYNYNEMSINLLTQLTHMYSSNSVQSTSVC